MKYLILFIILLTSCQTNKNNIKEIDKIITKENTSLKKDTVSIAIKEVDAEDNYIHELPIGIISIIGNYRNINLELLDSNYHPVEELGFKDEYSIKSFFCYSITNTHYQIEYEGLKYWILKNSSILKFETVQNHILSEVSFVSFDEKTNPIKILPSTNSNTIKFAPDEFYLPVKIENDWLKIKWGSEDNFEYGWIKWKKNDKLIIQFFYFA